MIFLNYIQGLLSHLYLKLTAYFGTKPFFKRFKLFIIRNNELFEYTKSIFEYWLKNRTNFYILTQDLDEKSKELVIEILKRISYIYTHSIIDKNKFFCFEELKETIELVDFIRNFKKQVKINLKFYDDFSIFYSKCGLKYLPKRKIEEIKNKDFIDCGAYWGDSALVFEKEYHPNKIYAFEPELHNYYSMLRTIKLNNLKKVIPINKGLGAKEQKVNFDANRGQVSINGNKKIFIVPIDDFVFKNNLNLGLIKMDIEGFEIEALKGAQEVIIKFKPILIISIYHNGKEFFETKNFIKDICPEYRFIIRKLNPTTLFTETILIAWI